MSSQEIGRIWALHRTSKQRLKRATATNSAGAARRTASRYVGLVPVNSRCWGAKLMPEDRGHVKRTRSKSMNVHVKSCQPNQSAETPLSACPKLFFGGSMFQDGLSVAAELSGAVSRPKAATLGRMQIAMLQHEYQT